MTLTFDDTPAIKLGRTNRHQSSLTFESHPHHHHGDEGNNPLTNSSGAPRRLPCSQVLEDEGSRVLLLEHGRYLQRLVMEGRDSLQSMGYYRSSRHYGSSNGGSSSLRSIVTGKLDRFNHSSILKLEADLTEAAATAAFTSNDCILEEGSNDDVLSAFSDEPLFFDGNLVFDFDEQQRVSDWCARVPKGSSAHTSQTSGTLSAEDVGNRFHQDCTSEDTVDQEEDEASLDGIPSLFQPPQQASVPVPASNRMIQITPELSFPLRGGMELWQAIRNDTTLATRCCGCQVELHVLEDAACVVCPVCWVVGNIEHSVAGIGMELEEDSDDIYGVVLGVRSDEVLQWVGE